jgi:hypothetical protein
LQPWLALECWYCWYHMCRVQGQTIFLSCCILVWWVQWCFLWPYYGDFSSEPCVTYDSLVGSFSIVIMYNPSEKFLNMGATIGVGLDLIFLSSLTSVFFSSYHCGSCHSALSINVWWISSFQHVPSVWYSESNHTCKYSIRIRS